MKFSVFLTVLLAFFVPQAFAEPHGHHRSHHDDDHDDHAGHDENSLAHQTQTRESLLKRLEIAPVNHICESNIHAVERAVIDADEAKMLGKVEYDFGKSQLGEHTKHAIEEILLRSEIHDRDYTLIAILGFADRTGRSEANLKLSNARAVNVKTLIDEINHEHDLGFRTTVIAMGEEVELCSKELGHNRVAEIWMVEFPKPVAEYFRTESVIRGGIVEERFISIPAQRMIPEVHHDDEPQKIEPVEKVLTVATEKPTVINAHDAHASHSDHDDDGDSETALTRLAEYLEHNVMLAPNADPEEFARQLKILKQLGK